MDGTRFGNGGGNETLKFVLRPVFFLILISSLSISLWYIIVYFDGRGRQQNSLKKLVEPKLSQIKVKQTGIKRR